MSSLLEVRRGRTALWMILPACCLVLAVGFVPLFRTFWQSLTNARLAGTGDADFIGIENYLMLLEDLEFREAVVQTLRFTAISVGLETILGLALALLLHRQFPGRIWIRVAALVPWAIPTVVSAQLWKFMLNDVYGVVNDIAIRFRLVEEPVAWLARPGVALGCVIAVDVWKTTPFMTLLLLAGLQSIPPELNEAARVDGAGAWQRFRTITLPLLAPMLLVGMLFRSMDALRIFDSIYVLTLGAFGTESMATYNRRLLIEFQDLGYGSACSVAIFLLIGVVSAVYVGLVVRRERAV